MGKETAEFIMEMLVAFSFFFLLLFVILKLFKHNRISNCKNCGGTGILPCDNTDCGCDGYPCVCVKPSKKKHIYRK